MSDETKRPKKRPDFYFNGDINWYQGDAFLAVQRGTAHALYWAALAWTRGRLENGFVPDAVITMLAACVKADAVADRAELLRVGLWVKAKGGIRFPDYDDWNDTRADVEARKGKGRTAINARWRRVQDTRGNTPSIPVVIQSQSQSTAPTSTFSNNSKHSAIPAREAEDARTRARIEDERRDIARRKAERVRLQAEQQAAIDDDDEPF